METYFYKQMYDNETTQWWYAVRRRLVHQLIQRYNEKKGGLAILDVGCGGGKLSEELQRYGTVLSIDPSPEAVRFSKSRGLKNVEQYSIENYPPGKQFDCIIALDILEHCQDDRVVIQKLHTLLKPDGLLIIFVPALRIFWSNQDVISHHYRRYNYQELKTKISAAGFHILFQSYFNTFLALPILLARSIMNLFHITKVGEIQINSPFTNVVFMKIFSLELPLLKFIKFPFGVSLAGVYKKSTK